MRCARVWRAKSGHSLLDAAQGNGSRAQALREERAFLVMRAPGRDIWRRCGVAPLARKARRARRHAARPASMGGRVLVLSSEQAGDAPRQRLPTPLDSSGAHDPVTVQHRALHGEARGRLDLRPSRHVRTRRCAVLGISCHSSLPCDRHRWHVGHAVALSTTRGGVPCPTWSCSWRVPESRPPRDLCPWAPGSSAMDSDSGRLLTCLKGVREHSLSSAPAVRVATMEQGSRSVGDSAGRQET